MNEAPDTTETPDYRDENAEPSQTLAQRLGKLALVMGQLELRREELEAELKQIDGQLRQYREQLVPEVMQEMGLAQAVTAGGIKIELREEVRASFPKDEEKRSRAFAWLEQTGDDGIIKREFSVRYGRDATEWATSFRNMLRDAGVDEHAAVSEDWSINHQTMLAYLRQQLRDGRSVPLEDFGAYVQSFAKIVRK
jgi:hypothetical protein